MGAGRVILADDDALLREGIASLLAGAGYDVLGQAGDAAGVQELVRDGRPDLVVIDIRMPPTYTTEGLDAAHAIHAEFPETGIVLLSAHVEVETALDLLEEGHRIGYLLKSRVLRAADFLDAVERVLQGGSVVDPALVSALVGASRRGDPLAELTPRESEVLALMAEGRSNGGIARRLYVTEGAVEKHVRSILMKLRLPEEEDAHRRVLAVLTYLEARRPASQSLEH
jgi:DNA-binding NarL/FixJ family response regulator